jgi:hypothetical protein
MCGGRWSVWLSLQEGLHTAAYRGGLGNPYMYCNAPITAEMLALFQKTSFTGDRVVVSAAGVDHAAFVGVRDSTSRLPLRACFCALYHVPSYHTILHLHASTTPALLYPRR